MDTGVTTHDARHAWCSWPPIMLTLASLRGSSALARASQVTGLALLLLSAACGRSYAFRASYAEYGAMPTYAPVAVFFDDRAVGGPFQVVGEVEADSRGRRSGPTVTDTVPELSARARSLGADAIIIDQATPVAAGLFRTRMYSRARAIRRMYGDPPATLAPAVAMNTTVFVPPPQQVIVVAPPPAQVLYANP